MEHFARILRHGAVMVRRNLRSYALLSVTIVLSFSLLLGYLLYTDSSLYNRYAWIMAQDPKVISITVTHPEDRAKLPALKMRLDDLDGTHTYAESIALGRITDSRYTLSDGREVSLPAVYIYGVPSHIWGFYAGSRIKAAEIEWLDGRTAEDISLKPGEMLMSRALFHALGLGTAQAPSFHLSLKSDSNSEMGERFQKKMRIVGLYSLESMDYWGEAIAEALTESELLGQSGQSHPPSIVISLEDFDPARIAPENKMNASIHIYTEYPELALQIYEQSQMKGGCFAVYEEQNKAREKIRTEQRTKAIIAAALLLLLGINLYSSFSNALNDRKFEIGVKRALGATGFAVIRQFLYESILVMLANTVLSVALVADIGILYKRIYESTPDAYGNNRQFILHIGGSSIAMFAVCAVSLTLVFSLIFAWKATQVKIVDYLKAE